MNEATATVVPAPQEIKLTPAQEARFWAKVNKAGPIMPHMESPCWIWTAGKSKKGYGAFFVNGKQLGTHRVAWVLANGQISQDSNQHSLFVCHRCDRRDCTNSSHLFLGTHIDNVRDMVAKGRHIKGDRHPSRLHIEKRPRGDGHYSRIHPERLSRGGSHYTRLRPEKVSRGQANGNSKLTEAKVIDIRTRYAAGGITLAALAAEFGVSFGLISHIVNRKTWKHIPAITTGPQCDTSATNCE
jgi:hypothetical protein